MTAWTSDIDLQALSDQTKQAAAQGVKAGADLLLDRSQPLVPVDDGALRASGRTSVDEAAVKAAVTYGHPGQDTGFAAIQQHEHTEYNHPSGGQAKFLEQPFLSETGAVRQAIADAIRGAFGT